MNQSQLYAFYDRDPEPIVSFLGYLREFYDLPRPSALLDMGCGPGRLLEPLARAGWTVTGYEPDPDYAVLARERAQKAGLSAIHQGGLLELNEERTFDLIAAVNGPYCYLLDLVLRREALQRCTRALRPGGVLFLEVSNFLWLLKNYRPAPVLEMDIEGVHIIRTAHHDLDLHRGILTHHDRFTWTDASGVAYVATKTHAMAMVSFLEIEFLLRETGFTDICTFNTYADRAPGELTGSKMLIAARVNSSGAS